MTIVQTVNAFLGRHGFAYGGPDINTFICFLPFYRVLSYKRFGFGVTGYVVYGE